MMKILVDADACPVKEIIEKVAKQKNIEVVMYIDSSHILSSDYSKVVTISKGRDAVDLALINDSEKGDVIVTQDYGVASLALGRSAYAIGNSGLIYDNNNIDKLMFERFLGQNRPASSDTAPTGGNPQDTDGGPFLLPGRRRSAFGFEGLRCTGSWRENIK